MKYAIKMGPGAMIYIQSFIKISSGIQKLLGQHGGRISLLLFFQNKESILNVETFMRQTWATLY
jgi:hypothetical protein